MNREICGQCGTLLGLTERLREGRHHSGYVIGQHWMSVAYDRICAGESQESVMADYGYARSTEIERLWARVAHLTLDIENLRAAVREACLIFSEHVLTQDIDGATDRAAYDYLAAHSIPEEKP